jgi:O-antigen/teichoic acid export membrane protein
VNGRKTQQVMPTLRTYIAALIAWLRARAGDRLVRNMGWYGLGELAVRVSRLITTIILARMLLPQDFGIAAIALTGFEMIRVLASNGVGQMIVRAAPEALDATCAVAWRLSFLTTAAMVLTQIAAGHIIATWMGRPDVFAMLALLALSYLALPLTEVCYWRILRANRVRAIAGINTAQVLLDNGLTAGLAIAGFGPWAVVLPKLLTTPLYVALMWRAEPFRLPRGAVTIPWLDVRRFALPVLGAEVLAALRLNLDKVLVGGLLGVEALGIYTFAFNAGLGLSLTLSAALSASLYPHLAEVGRDRQILATRFDAALSTTVLPIALIIALQSVAALLYVPIIFGERWAFAAPLVAIICLSGVARPFYDAASQMLRAAGETRRELIGAMTFTVGLLSVFAGALHSGGLGLAVHALAIVSVVSHMSFALWARACLGLSGQGLPKTAI